MYKGKIQNYYLFFSVMLLVLALNFDYTGLSLITPLLMKQFNLGIMNIQWLTTAYFIAAGCFFIPGGWLADKVGAHIPYLLGLIFFVIGALLVSLSNSLEWLIVARVLQGLGFAFAFNTGILLVKNAAQPNNQAFTVALMIMVASVTQALGPFFAGLIAEFSNWRFIFLLNVLIGAIALMLFMATKNKDNKPASIETTQNLSLYQKFNKPFLFSCLMRIVFNLCWTSIIFLTPIYLQNILKMSVIESGFYMLAMGAVAGLLSPVVGHWVDKINALTFIMLALIVLVGGNIIYVSYANYYSYLYLCLLYGVGIACMLPALTKFAMQSISKTHEGKGMGFFYTCSLLSSALSAPLVSSLLYYYGLVQATKIIPHQPFIQETVIQYASGSTAINKLPPGFSVAESVIKNIFVGSLQTILLWQCAIMVLFILPLCFKRVRRKLERN